MPFLPFSHDTSGGIVDTVNNTAALSAFALEGVSGSVTLQGFYVDAFGRQRGATRTITISNSSPFYFTADSGYKDAGTQTGATIGFIGSLSASVYINLANGSGTSEAPSTTGLILPAGVYAFGRVSNLQASLFATGQTTLGNVAMVPSSANGWKYTHTAANGTTVVKSGAGTLGGILIGTAGATDTITLYDNTTNSGTVISVIDASKQGNYAMPVPGIAFSTGLTAVIAGTTAPDVTFFYI